MNTTPTSDRVFRLLLTSLKKHGALIAQPTSSSHHPRAARQVAQLPVRYKWPDQQHWFTGMTANISQSGVFFELDHSDPRVIVKNSFKDPLDLAIAFTPSAPQSSTSTQCSVRCVRTIVASGQLFLNAAAVAVDTWRLPDEPGH